MASTDSIADILCYQILDNELHNLILLGVIFYCNLANHVLKLICIVTNIIYNLSVASKETFSLMQVISSTFFPDCIGLT